ncbi:hypothetical protein ACQ4WX_47990 [Streptomyces lasalocidi]
MPQWLEFRGGAGAAVFRRRGRSGEYELASNLVRDDVETPGGIKPDLRVSKVRPRVVPVPYGRYGPLVCATCCRHRRTGEPAGLCARCGRTKPVSTSSADRAGLLDLPRRSAPLTGRVPVLRLIQRLIARYDDDAGACGPCVGTAADDTHQADHPPLKREYRPMEYISGATGALILILVLSSILRTLVVPRGLYSALVFRLWWSLRRLLRLTALRGGYDAMDRGQTWLAPLMLIGMLTSWLAGALLGFGLLLYSLSPLSWTTAFREAGSSLFTLGFAKRSPVETVGARLHRGGHRSGPDRPPDRLPAHPLRRLQPPRTGGHPAPGEGPAEPAWGPEILARQWLVDTETALLALYRAWERLAADMGESHSTYPVLLTFRSPRPHRSWLVGLIAVMDAAAMQLALDPRIAPPEARLVLRAGFTALRDIARALRIPFEADPSPDATIRLTFAEFDAAVDMLESAGFHAERSSKEAWPHFQGWRVNYEAIAYELCRRCDAVPALWTGPRDFPGGPIPPARPADRRPGAGPAWNCPPSPGSSRLVVGRPPRKSRLRQANAGRETAKGIDPWQGPAGAAASGPVLTSPVPVRVRRPVLGVPGTGGVAVTNGVLLVETPGEKRPLQPTS